jgi:hypothetical protein
MLAIGIRFSIWNWWIGSICMALSILATAAGAAALD